MNRFFRSAHPVPVEYRHNFRHLYLDITWFGVVNGSILAFLTVFATRLGASSDQIGLLTAAPGIVALLFALPSGGLLRPHEVRGASFWSSLIQRALYLFLIPLPFLFPPPVQVVAIIVMIFVQSIPVTVQQVAFNALTGEAVPSEWRAHVAGIRAVCVSVTTILTTLSCGQLLDRVAFPLNYQIVFGLGLVGAAMSTYHVYYIRPLRQFALEEKTQKEPWYSRFQLNREMLRLDIVRSPFKKMIGLFFLFHFTQYLPMALFPIFSVKILHLPDSVISIGVFLFNLGVLIGSTQLERFSRRVKHRTLTGLGLAIIGAYPGLMSLAQDQTLYLLACGTGGLGWAMAGGSMFNYLLEYMPENDRPAHFAWYNVAANAGVLMGSLIGPQVGNVIGIAPALGLFAIFRILAGLSIVRWG